MSLTEGTVVGAYEIVRRIASGGMGDVYEGRHVELGRPVAIKVISDEIADDPVAIRRFHREALAASRLDHPHVCRMYDYHSGGDLHLLVLEYLEGETLADRLRRGSLRSDEAFRIGAEIAEGIDHAHRKGLVHRDLKPGNVMLTDSGAKVLDFGAVRRTTAWPSERMESLTDRDQLIGTLPYMSPEQVEGGEVDGRSDIYALGVILYEALTGRLPYTARTPAALAAAILETRPAPVGAVLPSLDPTLAAAVDRCLAKDPDDRWQSAGDLAAELRWARSGGVARRPRSSPGRRSRAVGWTLAGLTVAAALVLAVWPVTFAEEAFEEEASGEDAGPATSTDVAVLYFEDVTEGVRHVAAGITESLIEQLDGVEGLSVVSANGVKPFRGLSPGPDSVRRALGVSFIVDGSVSKSGDTLRVFAELVEAPSGRSVGTTTIVREWAYLMSAQREIADSVARLLRPWLGENVRLRELRSSTRSTEAWELVQRGQEAAARGRTLLEAGAWESAEPLMMRADSLLRLAAAADPEWVEPVLRSGSIAFDLASAAQALGYGFAEERHFARAVELAGRAHAMSPDHAGANELLGLVRWRMAAQAPADPQAPSNREAAMAHLRRAVELDPDRPSAYQSLSRVIRSTGRLEEAALYAEEALRRDRYLEEADEIIHRLWLTNHLMGDFETARRWCDEGRRRFPEQLGFVQCLLDDLAFDPEAPPALDSAWALYRAAERLDSARFDLAWSPYNPLYRLGLVAAVAAKAGMRDSAVSLVRTARERAGDDSYFQRTFDREEAFIRIVLGEHGRAVELLARYLEAVPISRSTVLTLPRFDPLRRRPDFEALTRGR